MHWTRLPLMDRIGGYMQCSSSTNWSTFFSGNSISVWSFSRKERVNIDRKTGDQAASTSLCTYKRWPSTIKVTLDRKSGTVKSTSSASILLQQTFTPCDMNASVSLCNVKQFLQRRRPRGDWGDGPPKFEVGGRPMHWSPQGFLWRYAPLRRTGTFFSK